MDTKYLKSYSFVMTQDLQTFIDYYFYTKLRNGERTTTLTYLDAINAYQSRAKPQVVDRDYYKLSTLFLELIRELGCVMGPIKASRLFFKMHYFDRAERRELFNILKGRGIRFVS